MSEYSGDKTQEPTPHRRQQAREKGQAARSQDLVSATILVAALLTLLVLGSALMEFFGRFIRRQCGKAWLSADLDFILRQWDWTVLNLAKVLLPILGLILLACVLVNILQSGLRFSPERLAPDLSRMSPLKGLKRMFSLSNAVRLGLSIFKILIIAAVAFGSLYNRTDEILALGSQEIPQIAIFMFDIVVWTGLKIGGALLILAALDYAFQRWKHEQDLKMTSQEVREEMKNLQGDPQTVSRRKAVQRELLANRLSDTVPQADVVITNPTELAIAIRYDAQSMNAPVVLAKGAGVLAQRIRRLALEHDIPIVEKKDIARALYKNVDVDHPIPNEQYAAVAEVLAYVYQLKGKSILTPPGQAA